jgi:protein-L-isoaspartate(D-aspartate) O-methyltransferase
MAATPGDDFLRGYAQARRLMVETQLRPRAITDEQVLEAMGRVPRHLFTPEDCRNQAYADRPLPIGHDQTISQPYIVALMTQLAKAGRLSRALDVGTGSGYQAAVLAEICREVYSMEIIPALADDARRRLQELGYRNVQVRCGDAYQGWPEHAPFDLIIVAAAPDHVPPSLIDQLAPGARLVLPIGGTGVQELVVVEKQKDGQVVQREVGGVAFVLMTGEALRRHRG